MRILFRLSMLLAPLCLPAVAAAQNGDVRLRPGDQLLIQVKNEPALSGRYDVGPDGAVMLPVIGIIDVRDRPFADIESAVRSGFARELADPAMIITPLVRVSVLGEVRLPGYQWVDATGTVTDLLVLSGGFLPTANRKRVTLVRGAEEHEFTLDRGSVAPRVPLRSGDQLVVPRRSWFSENLPIFIGAAASVAAAAVTSFIVR